jgi:hypothetical protein
VPYPAQTQAPFVNFYAICHSLTLRLAVSGGLPAAEPEAQWADVVFLGSWLILGDKTFQVERRLKGGKLKG